MSYIFKMIIQFNILCLWYIISVVSEVMAEGMVIIIERQLVQVRLKVRVTMLCFYVFYTVCQEMNHSGFDLLADIVNLV